MNRRLSTTTGPPALRPGSRAYPSPHHRSWTPPSLPGMPDAAADGWSTRPALVLVALALVVSVIRDIQFAPMISILSIAKYPVGFVGLVILLPSLSTSWRRAAGAQRAMVFLAVSILLAALVSAWAGGQTARLGDLIHQAEWIFLLAFGSLLMVNPRQVNLFFRGLLFFALLSGAIGMFWGYPEPARVVNPFVEEVYVHRFGGHGIDPNYFCMAVLFPYAVALVGSLDDGARSTRLRRIIWGVIGAFIIVAVLWSGSRSGMLALALVTPFAIFSARRGRSLSAFTMIALGLVVVTMLVGVSRMGNIGTLAVHRWTDYQAGEHASRPTVWMAALDNVISRPVWGWGPGALENMLRMGLYQGLDGWVKPHNAFIVTAIERGLVGLSLVTAVLAIGLRSAWRLARDRSHALRLIGVTILSGMLGQLLMSFTLGRFPISMFFVAACAAALYGRSSS